jgi:hypothetical protein
MPQPIAYDRQYNFTNFQTTAPTDPLPAQQVDGELNAVKLTLDQVLSRLALIQRDDGRLANLSVGADQADSTLSFGFTVPATWATGVAYAQYSAVLNDSKLYRAVSGHTAAAEFATDLAAGKWELLVDYSAETTAAAASAVSAAASAETATTQAGLTSADATATAADRVQTGLDAVATAADRVQTGLDAVATAADRVQTGLDRVATAADVVSAAAEAAKAEALVATSVTEVALGTGTKVFTTQAGKKFVPGAFLLAVSDGDIGDFMHGQIVSYAGTTLTVSVSAYGGTGSPADWTLSVSGARGAPGDAADLAAGAVTYSNATSGLTATDAQAAIDEIASGAISFVLNDQTAKTTLVDADVVAIADSEASNVNKKITWANFKAAFPAASDTVAGKVELATSAETITGTDTDRAVTPAGLAALTASDTRNGLVELATSAETITGTDTARAVTPAGLAALTATTTRNGLVELATDAETQTGTDATRAVTPASLAARTATASRTGVVELATDAETQTGTDATRAVTPAGLAALLYESSETAWEAGGLYTFTPPFTPKSVEVFLRCKNGSAVNGIQEDEDVEVINILSSTFRGVMKSIRSGGIRIRVGNGGINVLTSAGVVATTTPADWRLVVRAKPW